MRHMAHMKNLVFPLPVGQNRKMNQAGGDSHRIHLPHQGADPFFLPKDIGEIGELAPYIMESILRENCRYHFRQFSGNAGDHGSRSSKKGKYRQSTAKE